jgi:hypothetical protein
VKVEMLLHEWNMHRDNSSSKRFLSMDFWRKYRLWPWNTSLTDQISLRATSSSSLPWRNNSGMTFWDGGRDAEGYDSCSKEFAREFVKVLDIWGEILSRRPLQFNIKFNVVVTVRTVSFDAGHRELTNPNEMIHDKFVILSWF